MTDNNEDEEAGLSLYRLMARDHYVRFILLAPSVTTVVAACLLLLKFLRYASPDVNNQYWVLTW